MLERLARSPSKTFLVLTAAFAGGAATHAFHERVWLPAGQFAALAAAVFALQLAFIRRSRKRLAAAAAALFILGLWRYDAALSGLIHPEKLPPETSEFSGTVVAEPRQDIQGTTLIMDRIFVSGGSAPLSARMKLTVLRQDVGFGLGDRLSWRCRTRPVGNDAAGDMAADLVLRRLAWQCRLRELPTVLERGDAGAVRTVLHGFKDRLRRTAGALLPEPEASFLLGLLIGERQGLPPEMTDAFRQTGTSHILAVSGYNITRLVDIVFILCAAVALRRRRAAFAVSAVIIAFAAVVGGEASVVRAAFMGCTSLVSVLFARRYDGTIALLLAAALMLAANPFILRHDVGFQLSFAAVWGLHAFGRPLADRLSFLPEFLGIRQLTGETLAATLATLPVILHVFGRLPLIGPLVNLLILPLVPWAMAAGAIALITGTVAGPAGMLPAWICALILRVIEGVVNYAAALPLTVEIAAGPAVSVMLWGWIILLWYALNHVRPVVLVRRPATSIVDIEVIDIDHAQK